MAYPRCPSCDHELYDKSYRKCPFCGSKLTGSVLGRTASSSSSQARTLIMTAALLVVLGAGLGVYFAASSGQQEMERSETAIAAEEEQLQHICNENINQILDMEAEYNSINGMFTDDIEELRTMDESLPSICPQSGRSYKLIIQGDSIRVVCDIHGSLVYSP